MAISFREQSKQATVTADAQLHSSPSKAAPGAAGCFCWAPFLAMPSALCPDLGLPPEPLWLTAISTQDLALGSRLGFRGGVVVRDFGMALGLGERGLLS